MDEGGGGEGGRERVQRPMRLGLSRSRSSLSRSGVGSGRSVFFSGISDDSLLELGLILGRGMGMGHGNETDWTILRGGTGNGGRFSARGIVIVSA